jgi:HlyD family secretion protein
MTFPDNTYVKDIKDKIGMSMNRLPPRKKFWLIAGVVLLFLVGWFLLKPPSGDVPLSYKTETVTQGDLVVRVSATGNLQPTTEVDVSSELSGIIEEVLVKDNDPVKKDQVLARLDKSKLEDDVIKSEAALKSTQASVDVSKAASKEARSNLERLQKAWKLSGGKIPSKSEITTAEASLDKAVANEASALATVSQAEAVLRSNKTNLSKAEIRSTIDGIVLLRKIEPGQTVAASLEAPVLFVLAQDLKQMELHVQIDEADVGQVKEEQSAEFTVDAYPDRYYPARITRVRYGSETTNGVVTYQGVLEVTNDDLSLRPGMTATAKITTQKREKVLLVPNAALRYSPPNGTASASGKPSGLMSALMPRPPSDAGSKAVTVVAKGSNQTVWVMRQGETKPSLLNIKVGISDGRQTEVVSDNLKAGDAVVTESVEKKP